MLLKHAFDTITEGIYLHTRSDGRIFNLARLRAKTKVRKVLIRDMLFADDAAVVTHIQEELQSLMELLKFFRELFAKERSYPSTAKILQMYIKCAYYMPEHIAII